MLQLIPHLAGSSSESDVVHCVIEDSLSLSSSREPTCASLFQNATTSSHSTRRSFRTYISSGAVERWYEQHFAGGLNHPLLLHSHRIWDFPFQSIPWRLVFHLFSQCYQCLRGSYDVCRPFCLLVGICSWIQWLESFSDDAEKRPTNMHPFLGLRIFYSPVDPRNFQKVSELY